MYCKNCNGVLPNDAVFCPNCGALVDNAEDDLEATGLLAEEDDLEATGLLVEEDDLEATGLLIEEDDLEDSGVLFERKENISQQYTDGNIANGGWSDNDDLPNIDDAVFSNAGDNSVTDNAFVNPLYQKQAGSATQAMTASNTSVASAVDVVQATYTENNASSFEKPGFVDCFKKGWKNATNFNGRARRTEYWFFVLATMLLSMLPGVGQLYAVAAILPSLALIIRRLHDLGKDWYYIFFYLIPIAGPFIMLAWMCKDSQTGENGFGPNPKGIN